MKALKTFQGELLPLSTIIIFIGLWHLLAISGIFQSSFFPSPFEVLFALIEIIQSGDLFNHLFASLIRVLVGFLISASFAIPLGLVVGWYSSFWKALYPLVQIFRTISPVAWIPLAILWFGIGDKPAIFIVAITSFFPLFISCVSAVKNTDAHLIKVAKNFGATDFQILRLVVVPASLPPIILGMKISLGICWMIIVAAEMVGMRSGLGFLILDARNFLRTDLIIAGMIVIGLVGLLIDRAMTYLERKFQKHLFHSN